MRHNVIYQYTRRDLHHALKRADPTIFEDVLSFLEEDPKTFGSGYMKTEMWRSIRRYPLDGTPIARLEKAALKYLLRPISREFKPMCHVMSQIGSPDFWACFAATMTSDRPTEPLNARCLHAYSNGIMAGERQRLDTIRRLQDKNGTLNR